MPDSESRAILDNQRLHRPVAPHLGIYQPQITWYLSAFNRITGVTLSGAFYLFGMAYLVAPAIGWHLETQSLVAAAAALPLWAKIPLKAPLAFFFTFHSFNGLRHLMWDFGMGMKNKVVNQTGWTVVALSTVSALYLVFAY